jgi:prepilin-type N-terminal cleavage/methylation domain-containing protein
MTSKALLRRDPQKGKKEFSTNKGFTIIELMIVVGVLAILMSLALPSYRTLIEKRQVTSGAQQFAAFISSAKMEAVMRHQDVRLSRTVADDGSWCVGFASYAENTASDDADGCDCTIVDPTADGACTVKNLDGSRPELRVFDDVRFNAIAKLNGVDVAGASASTKVVSFDPIRGMLNIDGQIPSAVHPIEVKLNSKNDVYAINVRVSATGRVTMCSSALRGDYPVPGYDDCAEGDL